jgi:hypothetical protein
MYGPRLNCLHVYLRGCAVLILACASLASHAAAARFEKIYQNGNPIFVPTGNPGGVYTDGQSVWNRTLGLSPTGPVTTGAVGSFKNPSGKPVVVDVSAKLKPSAIAGAVGRALAKVLTPLAVGSAIFDLLAELNVSSNPVNGLNVLTQTTMTASCGLPSAYGVNSINAGCGQFGTSGSGPYFLPSTSICTMVNQCNVVGIQSIGNYAMPPQGTSTKIISIAELQDLVASKSGWPTSSALRRVLIEDVDKNPNFQREIEPTTVTGPATSPGTVSTTSESAAGTTSTSTTTHNHTYQGDTVNTTNVTTTVTTNTSTGAVTNTTTTTAPANEPPPTEDPCIKNLDRVGCSTLDTPEEITPRETKNVAFSTDAITWGAAASCPPPWAINVPAISKTFSVKYDPFCDIASRIRPFILAGAAFVAMMIVMAGIKV